MKKNGVQMISLYAVGAGCHFLSMEQEKAMHRLLKDPHDERLLAKVASSLPAHVQTMCVLAGLVMGFSRDFFRENCAKVYWTGHCSGFLGQPIEQRHFSTARALNVLDSRTIQLFEPLVGLPPFHNAEVLVGQKEIFEEVSMLSPDSRLPKELENGLRLAKMCMIRAGEVKRIAEKTVEVECNHSLLVQAGVPTLGTEIVPIGRRLIKSLRPGDFVTVHGRSAREKISKEHAYFIGLLTEKVIERFTSPVNELARVLR